MPRLSTASLFSFCTSFGLVTPSTGGKSLSRNHQCSQRLWIAACIRCSLLRRQPTRLSVRLFISLSHPAALSTTLERDERHTTVSALSSRA